MSPTAMTPSQALNLLGQAASVFVGTRADHHKLEHALKVLQRLVVSPTGEPAVSVSQPSTEFVAGAESRAVAEPFAAASVA